MNYSRHRITNDNWQELSNFFQKKSPALSWTLLVIVNLNY